ncbi:MAG: hypothetical protein U5M51_12740 [Emticicia sp.]|nr:hypothetical protein [Emticicia sp.]
MPIDAKMTLLPERCNEMVNVLSPKLFKNRREGGTTSILWYFVCTEKEGKYLHV